MTMFSNGFSTLLMPEDFEAVNTKDEFVYAGGNLLQHKDASRHQQRGRFVVGPH